MFWPVIIGVSLLAICMVCVIILLYRVHKKAHEPREALVVHQPAPVPVAAVIEVIKPKMKS